MTTTEIRGYCTLCRSRCGTIQVVENDQLVAMRPDMDHPTGGAMCMKGKAAPEIVHSPHRLTRPLRRTRPKSDPDPGWEPISWDEALEAIAQKLGTIRREAGAEAVAFSVTTPSGTPLSDSIDWIERFIRVFGSPNQIYASEICNWHKDHAHAFTFGCGIPPADYAQADTMMVWGHNPTNTWLAQANAIGQGRARGAKLVVVDPRPTPLAKAADAWLQVRPGTDTALALGLARCLIEAGSYDADFIRAWSNGPFLVRRDTGDLLRACDVWPDRSQAGFVVWHAEAGGAQPYDPAVALNADAARGLWLDGTVTVTVAGAGLVCDTAFALLRRAAQPYTPDEVARITGVQPPALMAAAQLLQGGRRVAYHAWTGVGQHTNATQTDRAIATLYALNGSFDRVGGNRIRTGVAAQPVNARSLMPESQWAKALGLDERPKGPPAMGYVRALDVYRAVLDHQPYPVRALVSFGTNLPVAHGDTALALQALQALEFHVQLDLFETPAARYADILLPVNSPWEHEGLRVGFEISDAAASLVQFRPRMVSPRGQSRSDNEIVFELASRLGIADDFFGGQLHAGWDHMLAPTGLSVAQLRTQPGGVRLPIDARERKYALTSADGVAGFNTPTRRVELYSETLHRQGQPAVATFVEPAEGRRQAGEGDSLFPLLLTSAKNGYFCHSQHRGLPSLRRRAPEPVAEISPALAQARALADGDWIRLSTRMGSARFVAKVTPGLADDVVVAEFGWWQACPELGRDGLPVLGTVSSNYNSLISAEDADPVSGSVGMRSFQCEIAHDTANDARQRKWTGWRPFRVERLQPEADGVLSIHLVDAEGRMLPDFLPGQHVQIRVKTGDGEIERAYSLSDAAVVPQRRGYRISVRHQRGATAAGVAFEGRMSGHLHTHLHVGDRVELKAPSGAFVLPRHSPQPLLLLAGGIGITPFISLLESLPDGDPAEIWLYYGNQHGGTHAFKARIDAHRRRLPGLRVFNHYAQPRAQDGLGIDFDSTERITAWCPAT
ncbi:MAG: Selenate reductase subunit alpha [Paracidovorax wautersii]|uniref:Selenate reductase subunit alpha n=1 Tax=Paracidovorax wautersii TaxID=1177982 RepID=A0A7V8JRV0_9BURK|nr:MAG: Selenate reductase subunit alpha [Paracidovorax wautersii]